MGFLSIQYHIPQTCRGEGLMEHMLERANAIMFPEIL
jgi:hypothetical protein